MARRRSAAKGLADDVMLEFRQRPQPDIELEEFFDLSIDPLSIIDFEGVFKRVNASFLRLVGYSEVELLSRSALDVLHPDDLDSARAALAQLAVGHDMVGFEARVVCADGSIRWLEWNTRSMQERGVVYSVGRDITDRRYVEAELRETQRSLAASRDELAVLAEEQAALGRVATLVAEGASPSVVLDAVAGEMERALGADGTLLLRYEPDQEVSVVAGRGSYPPELRLGTRVSHEGDNVSSTVRRTERPVRMDDHEAARGPIVNLARVAEPNVHSAVGAPIVVSGALWGVIGAQWTGERAPPADTEERMSKFAQLLGTAIANTESRVEVERLAQEQAALRRVATLVADEASQEEVLAAIAAEIGPLIGIEETRLVRFVDDRSAVTIASAGSSDEFPVGELVPADPGSGTPVARVLATGESVSFDPYMPGDGPVAATLRRMGIRSGVCAPIYVEGRLWGSINTGSQQEALARDAESRLAQFTDLLETAIANTESRAEVERLAQEQAALRRVATLVAEHPQSEELISAVAREVAGVMDVRGVIVERFEADGSQVILGRAYDRELAGADAFLGVGVRLPLHPGTLGAEVFATHRAARVEDYSKLQGMMGDAARAVGIGSGCAVPIVVDGRLWGQMCVYSRQGTVLPAGTEHQLDEFVQLVATAISNYDARASLRTLAAEQAALRRVATLVAKGVEPEEVFAAVAEETAATIHATTAVLRFEHDPPGVVLVGVSTETDGIDLPIGSRWDVDDVVAAAKVYRTRGSTRVDRAEWSSHRGPIGEAFRRLGIVSTVASPIIVEGRLWGVVAVNARDELSPDAEQRLEKFTDLVTTAIANAESKSELAASRARIAAAADDERRRVVRDLHDGAQQRLVHSVINLKLAQQALAKGAEDAPLLVQEAIENAEQATAELRELAHGILPSALSHGGLRAGVNALGSRTPVPVKIDVAVDRLPTPVEATAYFVAAEALTNMAKHSSAAQAEVVAQIEDGMLRVEVRDDGVGGARPDGSGLVGLADRLAVLDGRLEVHSPPGGGTRLTALIPLAG